MRSVRIIIVLSALSIPIMLKAQQNPAGLGFLSGGISSAATDVARDGQFSVGQGTVRSDLSAQHPVLWTPERTIIALGLFSGAENAFATFRIRRWSCCRRTGHHWHRKFMLLR